MKIDKDYGILILDKEILQRILKKSGDLKRNTKIEEMKISGLYDEILKIEFSWKIRRRSK